MAMARTHRYKFFVLGRYPARIAGNQPHLTVNLVAGDEEHLVYCGTLTMSDAEWEEFFGALRESLGDRVEVDETGDRPRATA